MPPADDHLRGLLELLAPDSLSVNGNELDHASQDEREAAAHAATQTKPGDIILVTTGGFVYSTGRYLTQQPWDHALLVVDATKALHVGFPRICYVSLERVLLPKRQPAIYRVPSIHASPNAQTLLQKYAQLMQDTPYDLARAILLGRHLMLEHLFNIQPTTRTAAPPRRAWVCTDAILSLLAVCSPTFHRQLKANTPRLHLSKLGIASLKDFQTLHHHSVLDRVPLPPYNFNVQPTPAFDTAYFMTNVLAFPNPVVLWDRFHSVVERWAAHAVCILLRKFPMGRVPWSCELGL
ncbi:hypothetical protein, variant [Aphanomyces astaci]|uniref:Uncharacterized protein n=1 Tax=Aphanomyces astaci TaxID=112090 RepID=W4FH09_APHAT|nr:hypothetical protein, variant [Aphanomyces astaci]ETV66735.1 hypothetical protein, variant [Aphanomyces astaci]|eukprot:XP_009843711.1 hypothetical protein, variant [Aphanomyces astaci]